MQYVWLAIGLYVVSFLYPDTVLMLQVHHMSRFLDAEAGTGISMSPCIASQVIDESRPTFAWQTGLGRKGKSRINKYM